MSRYILCFRYSQGGIQPVSQTYDYDTLIASGFTGGGMNGEDLSLLNGEWTRTTTTDDATLQINGFKTEQWEKTVTINNETVTLTLYCTEIDNGIWGIKNLGNYDGQSWLTSGIENYSNPWIITSNEWWGEMAFPISSGSFAKSSV